MRAAERREEVVHRYFVSHVYDREAATPLVTVSFKQVVLADSHIEQTPWKDTLWIVIVVLCTGRWNLQLSRTELRGGTNSGQGNCWGRGYTIARQSGLELLIGG